MDLGDVVTLHELLHKQANQINILNNELEQERVRLAGCLTAAEGATSENHIAKKGDYGWSFAYQKVLELRLDYDALRKDNSCK